MLRRLSDIYRVCGGVRVCIFWQSADSSSFAVGFGPNFNILLMHFSLSSFADLCVVKLLFSGGCNGWPDECDIFYHCRLFRLLLPHQPHAGRRGDELRRGGWGKQCGKNLFKFQSTYAWFFKANSLLYVTNRWFSIPNSWLFITNQVWPNQP